MRTLFCASRPYVMTVAMVLAVHVAVVTGFARYNPSLTDGGEVSWSQAPNEVTDWYWCYDDASDQPFDEPLLAPMLVAPYIQYSIKDVQDANKLAPYNDEPFKYTLPDSFWYFGYWYEPGDGLYLSPDGWLSFDAVPDAGYPYPPSSPVFPVDDPPNAVIATLWQDNDPTRTPGAGDQNRLYYYYDTDARSLRVEWYRIQGYATGNTYTYMAMLALGGQDMLDVAGQCGVTFSRHYIHFLYNTCSAGWDADGGETGFEDPTGEHGIHYQGVISTTGDDFHAVRCGYKRIFKNDVQVWAFLTPGSMTLRYTPTEVRIIVRNIGQETEHSAATVEIWDESERVYYHNLASFDLLPGMNDTLIGPCWTPGEVGTDYELLAYTQLERDRCKSNDTAMQVTCIHCDDTLRYSWDESMWIGWGISYPNQVANFLPVDGGVLSTGARIWITNLYSNSNYQAVLWQAEDGCGLPYGDPVACASPEGNQAGWNYFEWSEHAVFVPSSTPGNVWAGIIPGTSVVYPAWLTDPVVFSHPCFGGSYYPAAYYDGVSWNWSSEDNPVPSLKMDLFVHLSFGHFPLSPAPAPPCHYEQPHDVTCYRMEEPDQDYVEAGVPITPELAIANIGRDTEPVSGLFPVTFMAVDEKSGDTVFRDSTLVSEIGWLGDAEDDPDSMFVTTPPWTPEALCDEDEPYVHYELIGLVRLGEVGPDSSDHCPYNDTVRRFVVSLLTHDVGVTDLVFAEEPDEPPDRYNPGSTITCTATVENFGFSAEHDIPVRLEVMDVDSNVLLWHNIQQITFLNWRGNTPDEPYTIDVTFPPYTVFNDHHQTFETRTELIGDMCPDNDECVRHCCDGINTAGSLPMSFSLEIKQMQLTQTCEVEFAVPRVSWVKVDVFEVSGRWISSVVNDVYNPGVHRTRWDGNDNIGRKVAAGIYLLRMEAGDFQTIRKLIVID